MASIHSTAVLATAVASASAAIPVPATVPASTAVSVSPDNRSFTKRLTVLFYHTAYMAPTERQVSLRHGWLAFGNNEQFYEFTGFPQPGRSYLTIFDCETREFVPILTIGGVPGDLAENPWIIIRRREMKDKECLHLEKCIDSLLQSREAARRILSGKPVRVPVVDEGGIMFNDEGETEIDETSDVEGASVQALDGSSMIDIFDSHSDDDPDYQLGQSDMEGSDSDAYMEEGNDDYTDTELEGDEEESEEEAVETDDDDDEVEVIIDLTMMSDDD